MDTVRVVVADDNIQLRDMVAEYLQEQNGIEVVGTAGDGVETLRLVTECEPDVLVCDLIMPQMDGYAVLERLQAMKLSKQPGVIALTALGRDDFISRAVNLGVNYYMVKPFDFMMLAQRVYEAAGESLRAEAISAKMIKQQGGKTGGETLEERIANLFLTVGIPAHIKGYQYLREAVRMVMDNPELMGASPRSFTPALPTASARRPARWNARFAMPSRWRGTAGVSTRWTRPLARTSARWTISRPTASLSRWSRIGSARGRARKRDFRRKGTVLP